MIFLQNLLLFQQETILQIQNNEQMSYLEKIRSTFIKERYTLKSYVSRAQLEQFLNSLLSGEQYDSQVVGEIWEQASEGRSQTQIDQICQTIIEAQNIVKEKLFELKDIVKSLKDEVSGNSRRRTLNVQNELKERQEEKKSFEEDLRLLTQPFGIDMPNFMANAAKQRNKGFDQEDGEQNKLEGNEIELRWLFYLCLAFSLIEIIVIYRKYDFLNLMVVACILSIFVMSQFDSIYIKFSLGLLIVSQILDMIWLFMNANEFWNPPTVGTSSRGESGYLKIIIVLTFLGIFVKIPLGVFLYHYRNVQNKQYNIDLGIVKMQITPNKANPLSQTIKGMQIGVDG